MKYLKFILIFIFIIISCKSNNNEENLNLMSRRQFIKILIEIHKADGLLGFQSLSDQKVTDPDSLSYYNQIFKKYDISREEFYRTIKYYLENMDKFIEIQKIVIDSLKEKYVLIDSLERLSLKNNDLWDMKRKWNLPEDGVTNSIPFKIMISIQGVYTLSASVLSYNDDLTKDLELKIVAVYDDQFKDEKKIKISVKNSSWKDYSVSIITNPNKSLRYIEGEVLSHNPSTTYMHVAVKDIMLVQKSTEETDTLKNEVPEK